ncbi:FG-GAP-like repeat-containing protein [Ekhidna sp.]
MRKLLIISFLFPLILWAQKPFVSSISPTHTQVGETITITGTNLGGSVFFGGVQATSVSGSGNTMTAVVPPGATHGVVTVINNGLVAQSSQRFFISFNGSTINNFDPEFLVSTAQTDAYDVCICDLDNDGLNDLAMAHFVQSSDNSDDESTIYRNNTTGTDSYTAGDFALVQSINTVNNSTGFIAVTCGDLNNDGIPELVFSSNRNSNPQDIFIYENSGPAINMTLASSIKLPSGSSNRLVRKVKIADIDGDGNSDLVVGNQTDGVIIVYAGNGDFTFDTPSEITVTGTINTSSLDIADFNNDGRTDIVSLPFREQNEVITVLQNNSQPNNISFEQAAGISTSARRVNVKAADFDKDGFIDIVATNQQLQRVTVYRNTTTGTGEIITFATGVDIAIAGAGPWGVDIGDMNGDGKPDLIIGSTTTVNNLYVIENNSTSGLIVFDTPTAVATTNTNQNSAVGDLNGDGRPDIAFTHNIQLGNPGNLGIFLNRNCVEPEVTPNSTDFCFDDAFRVYATKTAGATYLWEIIAPATGSITTPNADNTLITINGGSPASTSIRVTVTHDTGETYECSQQQTATYNLIGGVQPGPPTITGPATTVCFGDPFTLDVAGGPFDEFEWTLPDGSTVTTSQINITSSVITDAGNYSLRVKSTGGCFSEESTDFLVEVSQPPLFEILNSGLDNFCEGTSLTLSIPDFTGSFTYQWQREGTDLATADENNASVSVNQSGNYSVEVTDVNTCTTETAIYTVNAISEPVSIVNGPSETCVDFETTFLAESTGQSGFTLEYSWQVDGSPVSPTDPTQLLTTFTTTGPHTVTLTTSYNPAEVASCSNIEIFNVTVSEAPTLTFDQSDLTAKCQAESLIVALSSPDAASISSYTWAIRNANPANDTIISTSSGTSLEVTTPIGVDTVYAIVEITTTIGCQVKDSIRIRNFPSDIDISSPGIDASTDIVTLEEDNFISLMADNVSGVTWEPSEIFDNPTQVSTLAFPNQPSTTITLTGTDSNGCTVSTQLELILDNLRPKKTFSPNGDGINDCWEILNSSQDNTLGCKIYIFDARGKNIRVADAPFVDNCVWDGNSSSSPVPEGVYYFVFKCNDTQMNKSGSILLAR